MAIVPYKDPFTLLEVNVPLNKKGRDLCYINLCVYHPLFPSFSSLSLRVCVCGCVGFVGCVSGLGKVVQC